MPLPLLIPALAAGAQAGLGLYQTLKANKDAKNALAEYKANPYTIPESATRSVNLMGRLAQGSELPGQGIMEDRLAANTAQSVAGARKVAQSPSQLLAATVASYGQQQQQQQMLDLQAANSFQQRQQAYAQTVGNLAGYEDKMYQYNKIFPIQAKLNKASMMGQTGWANIGAGVSGGLGMFANQQYLKGLNTQGQASTPPSTTVPQTTQPFDYWGGGQPDTGIQQRQGNY